METVAGLTMVVRTKGLLEMGVTRGQVRKWERAGVLVRRHVVPGDHGFFLREDVMRVVNGESWMANSGRVKP